MSSTTPSFTERLAQLKAQAAAAAAGEAVSGGAPAGTESDSPASDPVSSSMKSSLPMGSPSGSSSFGSGLSGGGNSPFGSSSSGGAGSPFGSGSSGSSGSPFGSGSPGGSSFGSSFGSGSAQSSGGNSFGSGFLSSARNGSKEKYAELKKQVINSVIDQVNQEAANGDANVNLRNVINDAVNRVGTDASRSDRQQIAQEVYNEVVGLGPLEELMADPSITEIMVNGPKQIYIERKGKLVLSKVTFDDDAHVMRIIDRIVSRIGRRCDESNPMVDARLADGSRVNAVIRPISLKGPSITIRRFNSSPLQVSDLIKGNSMSYAMASFLEAAIKGKCNVIVSGGTGSGKTTLLNVLSGFIPENERIVTIEDAAELQLKQDHVVTMESRPANIEGAGAITIRDLVRNALRMRPDRIIVGEVRSGETLDMLQAMNTGHDGSLTTVHANSPRDVMSRLETMVLMGGMDLPVRAIRDQISAAIDLVVQQARFRDGSRKIVSISEVLGMEGETIVLQDIFVFKQEGLDSQGNIRGRHMATGIRPKVLDKLKENGIMVSEDWFI